MRREWSVTAWCLASLPFLMTAACPAAFAVPLPPPIVIPVKLADLPVVKAIPEPAAENDPEALINIVISNAKWANSAIGDVVFGEHGKFATCKSDVTGGFTYSTCSDLLRFINVNNVANIFFLSDPIINTTQVEGPFGIAKNRLFIEEPKFYNASRALTNGFTIKILAASDSNPSTGTSDAIKVFAPVPEPPGLTLLGAALLCLGLLRRRGAKA